MFDDPRVARRAAVPLRRSTRGYRPAPLRGVSRVPPRRWPLWAVASGGCNQPWGGCVARGAAPHATPRSFCGMGDSPQRPASASVSSEQPTDGTETGSTDVPLNGICSDMPHGSPASRGMTVASDARRRPKAADVSRHPNQEQETSHATRRIYSNPHQSLFESHHENVTSYSSRPATRRTRIWIRSNIHSASGVLRRSRFPSRYSRLHHGDTRNARQLPAATP